MPANMLFALVTVDGPSTCVKEGRMLDGPPFTKEIAIARSMPANRAFVRNACSLAAALAPRKLRRIT